MFILLFLLVSCSEDTAQSTDHSLSEVSVETKAVRSIDEVSVELNDSPAIEQDKTDQGVSSSDEVQVSSDGHMRIHFIDAGQADATLIQVNDHVILFDAGNWNRRDVVDYLLYQGIDKIDLLIGSHPDADHIGQFPLILNQFEVSEVWMNGVQSSSQTFERTIDLILEKDVPYHEPEAGESFQVGGLILEVLGPILNTGEANEDSIVIRFRFGSHALMLTGDAGTRSEQAIINQFGEIRSHFLQLGHHGSITSSSEAFLAAVRPEIIVISASENNSYGHPHEEVLSRAIATGATIYQTSKHGHIVLKMDQDTFKGVELTQNIEPINTVPDPIIIESNPKENSETPSIDEDDEKEKMQGGICVDINHASKEELMSIIHIGDSRAGELIRLRPFNGVEDLTRINGIGPARIDDIIEQNIACVR